MKVKLKGKKIKLTIETEEELCDLWHRMNIASVHLEQYCHALKHTTNDSGWELWKALEDLVIEKELNKR